MCECMTMARTGPHDTGLHHHKKCPKYETEKFPYLFYYEEAVDGWVPVPEKVEGELICIPEQLNEGETVDLQFKRIDMTDQEFDAMPED